MALWGKKDQANNAPKWLSDAETAPMQNSADNAILIDNAEVGTEKQTGGWNLYKEYGNGRKYIETLVAMRVTPADATPDPAPTPDPETDPEE